MEEQRKGLRKALGKSTTLAGFLNALRGAQVEVHNGAVLTAGRLLRVEEKTTHKGPEETAKTLEISLVADGGTVRTFPLTSSGTVRSPEPDPGEEHNKYLSLGR